ncbi:rhodanese-like domain-containing protein [Parapedobacter sp.]
MRCYIFLFVTLLTWVNAKSYGQEKTEPWNNKQLLETEVLASKIAVGEANDLLILSIGPDAIIKGSIDIGPAGEKEHTKKLRAYLKDIPRDREVVVYCGCCPFDRCPNVRPAFIVLNEMGFKKGKLLNIRRNVKVDWLDKDYPVNE